jgi:hypothetical protein
MAATSYRVEAEWDDEARVWIATSDDIPGLSAEAATLEELTAVVVELALTLLVANGVLTEEAAREVPLVIAAERHAVASLAA